MSFEDIKGQDSALWILKQNIQEGRIFSNYLFVGPDGVGKLMAAKNFAKAINCLNKKRIAQPCEACVPCRKINLQIHPDVTVVESKGASTFIGIDQIRSVIRSANLKPYEAGSKIFIINDAHSMSAEAANAFLKTLEEPPEDTIFILISRSRDLLFSTIVSRCHIVKFFSARGQLVENVLTQKFNIKESEAKILSNFSSGRIGAAIRMKEEGLIDRKNRMIKSLLNTPPTHARMGGTKTRFPEEISVYSDREELKENLEFLISFFRDILLYKRVTKAMIFHIDRIDEIKRESQRLAPEELDYLIRRVITLRSYIDYNVNPKIIIDVLINELRNHYARNNTGKAARSG